MIAPTPIATSPVVDAKNGLMLIRVSHPADFDDCPFPQHQLDYTWARDGCRFLVVDPEAACAARDIGAAWGGVLGLYPGHAIEGLDVRMPIPYWRMACAEPDQLFFFIDGRIRPHRVESGSAFEYLHEEIIDVWRELRQANCLPFAQAGN